MRRILISGSRDLTPSGDDFENALTILKQEPYGFEEFIVVHGGARGVDREGGDWALTSGYEEEVHYADWDKHSKAAGHIRNAEMVNSGIDLAIVFWDGESKGTTGTMKLLRQKKIPHVVTILYV